MSELSGSGVASNRCIVQYVFTLHVCICCSREDDDSEDDSTTTEESSSDEDDEENSGRDAKPGNKKTQGKVMVVLHLINHHTFVQRTFTITRCSNKGQGFFPFEMGFIYVNIIIATPL